MNQYIDAQITNMKTMVDTFNAACKIAALQDDGTISNAEARLLKRIANATHRYSSELEKISKLNKHS